MEDKIQIIDQIKYDIYQIGFKSIAIKKAETEMLNLKGKPAFDTRAEACKNWEKEIEEHKKMFDIYVEKLNKIL